MTLQGRQTGAVRLCHSRHSVAVLREVCCEGRMQFRRHAIQLPLQASLGFRDCHGVSLGWSASKARRLLPLLRRGFLSSTTASVRMHPHSASAGSTPSAQAGTDTGPPMSEIDNLRHQVAVNQAATQQLQSCFAQAVGAAFTQSGTIHGFSRRGGAGGGGGPRAPRSAVPPFFSSMQQPAARAAALMQAQYGILNPTPAYANSAAAPFFPSSPSPLPFQLNAQYPLWSPQLGVGT